MILAYSNLSDPFIIQLFDNDKNLIDTLHAQIKGDPKKFRFDLLQGISELLGKNAYTPQDVNGILVVNGPGRFTPVRTACLVANMFYREQGAKLCTLSSKEFEKTGNDFRKIINEDVCIETTFVKPVFSGPPRIH